MLELKISPCRRVEETEMDSIAATHDGHTGVKKYMEGERVEVRQREKGLRGSWFPAVIIAVKQGKRIVEYDELLTDDGGQKLTESIPVGRGVDGVKAPSRTCLKSHSSWVRSIIRPRPPPTPDASKFFWKTGLCVDCYHKDAWWEGVLQEDISRNQKRASVFFPEEFDFEAMSLKNMRVGQDWDEDLGRWIPRGHVTLANTRKEKRVRTLSLGREGRDLGKSSSRDMKLAIALQIEDKQSSEDAAEHTSGFSNDAKTPLDNLSLTLHTDSSGEMGSEVQDFTGGRGLPPADETCGTNSGETGAVVFVTPESGTPEEALNTEVGNVSVRVEESASTNDDIDIWGADESVARNVLMKSGWNVTQNLRKTGKIQWYYRAPGGTLLGSLPAALKYWEKIKKIKKGDKGDDENPTLNDLKLQTSVTRDRKVVEDSPRLGTPKNGKKNIGAVPNEAPMETPSFANCFIGSRSLSPIRGSCPDRISDTRIGDDKYHYDKTNFKRSASELQDEYPIADDQKRRKTVVNTQEQIKYPLREERGQILGPGFFGAHLSAGNDFAVRRRSIGRVESTEITDVKIVSLTSKKRVCTAEEISHDPNSFSAEGRRVVGEPRIKKSRAISTDVLTTLEGSGRKSLITLQDSLQKNAQVDPKHRKKPFGQHRAIDIKQTKKSSIQDFKQVKKSAKKGKKSRAPARGGVRLEVLLSAPSTKSDPLGDGDTLLKKRTLLSWLIDNGMVEENERVRYLNRKDNHCMLEGYVSRDGIRCDCCRTVVTLSVFEAHAGSKLHRPSANIFLDNGKSLSECQVEALARKNQNEVDTEKASDESESADKSDDTCGICGDGGELICCDHCPSTFHLSCMGMEVVPDGDWFCPNCRCAICGGSQFNGDKSSFNDLTVIFCDQCECEYHVKCLRSRGIEFDSCPQEDWFCGESCGRIFRGLRGLVGFSKPMEGGFSWTLLRSRAEDDRKSGCVSNTELNAEHDSKLSIALSVMQECFRPMIDPRTKIDIISHVLYNRRSEVSRLNYHGFYTMLLENGDELISVATIRVHGARLAEMPLIGTRFAYRRKGMCRRLMSALEEMLRSVGVERLVLPAVPELLETWTGAFGFMNMEGSERLQLMDLNIMAFPGTSLLYKPLGKPDLSETGMYAKDIKGGRSTQSLSKQLERKLMSSSVADYCLGPKPDSTIGAIFADVSRRKGPIARTPLEDDRKKFVCPAEARKKRGRFARPRKGNLFGSFLSGVSYEKVDEKPISETVNVWIEQVTRFGEDTGCVMFRPASPTGSVLVECARENGSLVFPTAASREFHAAQGEREAIPGDSFGQRRTQGDELQAQKAATSIILKSVLGVGPPETYAMAHSKVEDANRLLHDRSSSEDSQSSEEDEELDHSLEIRKTTTPNREVKTPGWLIDSIKEAAKIPARPVRIREKSLETRGFERPLQAKIPSIESATGCSTKTYERRRTKLSPLSQREPLSRIRQMELADSDPISRTLDFSSDDLDSVQYYEIEPIYVPMRVFPSQFSYQNHSIMPHGTFLPVQTDVVNNCFRGESGVTENWHTEIASSEDNISSGSYDQRDDYKSRGTGLMVRLKLNNLNLESKKKKKKKKRSKDLTNSLLDRVQECSTFAEEAENSSIQAGSGSGSESRNRDREVTSPEPFKEGQSKKMDRVVERKYISVTVN